jgi:spoIIIJ-associated protein
MKEVIQEGKTREEALDNALKKLNVTEEEVIIEELDGSSTSRLFGLVGAKGVRIKVSLKEHREARVASEFLEKILELMGIDGKVLVEEQENQIKAWIEGKEAGILIGKFGQTIDSLQNIVNVVIAKEFGSGAKKVVIDAEDYRERREKALIQLAKNMASKVVKTQKGVVLAPMSPKDRRIIHLTLADYDKIETHSEGAGVHRKVIITYKGK